MKQYRPKMLIVEDEERLSRLLGEAFRGRYLVRIASDGETAVQSATVDPPDIVLLDVNIPRVSGLEVLKRMRALYPKLPVIMMTGISDDFAVTTALMRGAFAYIPKPFTLQYVEHLVDAAAQGPPRAETADGLETLVQNVDPDAPPRPPGTPA